MVKSFREFSVGDRVKSPNFTGIIRYIYPKVWRGDTYIAVDVERDDEEPGLGNRNTYTTFQYKLKGDGYTWVRVVHSSFNYSLKTVKNYKFIENGIEYS
jgi:hypothetical protein